jgi:FixJ family two-component response regulator
MDAQRIITAALNGAKSYLVWPFTDAEFTGAVDDAIARVNWNHAGDPIAQYKVGLLSDREKSIVQGVVEGQSSREIAQRLGSARARSRPVAARS